MEYSLVIKIIFFLLVIFLFGASIFIHELGHYLAAKWRGLQIDRFSVGFGPKIFSKTASDGVEWRLSWIPLGGYVALPQMVDMGPIEGGKEDTQGEEARQLPPISFSDKVYVAVAGPLFNVLFALVLGSVIWILGKPTTDGEMTNVVGHVSPVIEDIYGEKQEGPAYAAGLQAGDIITAIDGSSVSNFNQIQQAVLLGSGRSKNGKPQTIVSIERDGQAQDITVQTALVATNLATGDEIRQIGIGPQASLIVDSVMPDFPAQAAGLQAGDKVLSVNGEALYSIAQLNYHTKNNPDQALSLAIDRAGQAIDISLSPKLLNRTKPLLTIKAGADILTLQPMYGPDFAGRMSSPEAPASLMVHAYQSGPRQAFRGMRIGQTVTHINGIAPDSVAHAQALISEFKKENALSIKAAEQMYYADITPQVSIVPTRQAAIIGIVFSSEPIIIHPNPIQQLRDILDSTFRMLGSLIHPKSDVGLKQLNSPLGIGNMIYKFFHIDYRLALWLVMFLNVNLAIMNLMPIPVLDGGHILLATISKLWGKPIPLGILSALQGGFMIMLLGLMFFIVTRDASRIAGENISNSNYALENSLYISPPEPALPQK